jgi:hypothetical protein
MAVTLSLSPKELERIAAAAYEGKRVRVFLASLTNEGYDASSTVANWETIRLSGNGYADYREVIAIGSYDTTDLRYEIGGAITANGFIDAEFAASSGGVGYSYNRAVVVIQSVNVEKTISYVELTSNVATITTTAAHGLTAGAEIVLSGMTNTTFNGTYTVVSAPTTTTLTFNRTSADVPSTADTGSLKTYINSTYPHSILTESPVITLAPAQVMTYRIQLIIDD